jgi:small subunit ribosomal protein S2
MAIITVRELMDAGIHYGAKASLWHPRMKPYIYGRRNTIHIMNLRETAKSLIEAHHHIRKMGQRGQTLLLVGTKRQARDLIREAAKSIGMPFVTERWLGGTLTNIETIRTSVKRLEDIERDMSEPDYLRQSKKEQARHGRERRRLLRNLDGIRTLNKIPDAIFLIDPKHEDTCVAEATRMGVPVIGLVDSDTNPDLINLPIPGNDEGIRSIQLVVRTIVNAYREGTKNRQPETVVASAEPALEPKA